MTNTTDPNINKFVLQRRAHRLDGICDLLVEYGVTIEELTYHLLNHYETKDAKAFRKRTGQLKKQRRIDQARSAVSARYDRQGNRFKQFEDIRDAELDRQSKLKRKVDTVPKPDFLADGDKAKADTTDKPKARASSSKDKGDK